MEDADMMWSLIMNQARSTYTLLQLKDLTSLRDSMSNALAIGPFIDPTAYMNMDRDGVRENGELLDATIAYVKVLDRIHKARCWRQGKYSHALPDALAAKGS